MKRVLAITVVASLFLMTTGANVFAIPLTQPEMHQFFDGITDTDPGTDVPTFSDADVTQNPEFLAQPGTTVWLPIWIRPLASDDIEGDFLSIRAYNFETHAVEEGQGDQFSYSDGFLRDLGYPTRIEPQAGDGSAATNGNPGNRLSRIMGASSASDTLMRSDGAGGGGLAFDNVPNGAYYLGFIAVDIAGTAQPGDTLTVYLNTPRGDQEPGQKYATNQTGAGSGTRNTIAYGANDPGDGSPNNNRFTDVSQDAVGLAQNHFTDVDVPGGGNVGDGVIGIIPEPGTLGLLALGLLGIRRRRHTA